MSRKEEGNIEEERTEERRTEERRTEERGTEERRTEERRTEKERTEEEMTLVSEYASIKKQKTSSFGKPETKDKDNDVSKDEDEDENLTYEKLGQKFQDLTSKVSILSYGTMRSKKHRNVRTVLPEYCNIYKEGISSLKPSYIVAEPGLF